MSRWSSGSGLEALRALALDGISLDVCPGDRQRCLGRESPNCVGSSSLMDPSTPRAARRGPSREWMGHENLAVRKVALPAGSTASAGAVASAGSTGSAARRQVRTRPGTCAGRSAAAGGTS